MFFGLLILLQTACASNTYWAWEHKDFGRTQLEEDRKECRQMARLEADRNPYYYDFRVDPFDWPYHPRRPRSFYHNDWYWRYHERLLFYQDSYERFFRICLRAKGWERVKKTRDVQKQSVGQERK